MNPSFSPRSSPDGLPSQPAYYSIPRNERFGKRKLPQGYAPDSTAVICGRGKACTASPGNRRLKSIVKRFIGDYSKAQSKAEKTTTVNMIMDAVQGTGRDQGMFVRQQDGSWWEVEDTVAREKVGCLIRDCLHTQYRSSSKAKFLKKRRAQIESNEKCGEKDSPREHKKPTSFLQESSNAAVMPSFLPGLFSLSGVSTGPQSTSHTGTRPSEVEISHAALSIQDDHRITGARRVGGLGDPLLNIPAVVAQISNNASGVMSIQSGQIKSVPSQALRGASFSGGEGSESSPDSMSWGIAPGRGRGYLQLARDVIGDDGNVDNLPDDLSGIFD